MINQKTTGWFMAVLLGCTLAARANSPVDCNCLTNLPVFQVNGCIGIVPDLCTLATNCFSSNVVSAPGFCTQSPGPYTPVPPGITTIQFFVTDSNNNTAQCSVNFVVTAPPANLSLVCASNKTVECGTAWQFDPPIPSSTCCDQTFTTIVLSSITNGTCPKIITRTWKVTDGCSNNATCSQTVTVADTTPPVTQCSFNLVPNPGFEGYTNCPDSLDELSYAFPWFKASVATADYYNSCSPVGNGASTPLNVTGYQVPLSGQGYGGAIVYSTVTDPTNSYREYLEVPLIAPLQAGQLYRASFYVSVADDYGWAIAEIGAYFSSGPVVSNATTVFNLVPQVVNPSYNVLNSTSSWLLVQGTFTAAGGEDHMTIGNFLSDAATTAAPSGGAISGYGYYYFDDVSVEAVCGPGTTNKTIACGSPLIFDPPTGFDLCSGTNVTVSIASTVFSNSCPVVATRTWTLRDLCGNTNAWSQSVTMLDTNPPFVLCSGTNFVPNAQFESYTNCPNYAAEFSYAAPWFAPTFASPDYFNACAGPTSVVSVPTNFAGIQPAFSGQGYAGAILYTSDGNDAANAYREYIEVPLLAPLVASQSYLVSFRVSLADFSAWAMAEVGAHFSVGPLTDYASQVCLPVTPQVMNPANNLLTSTNSWMLVQGVFTASGGENYLTIGNFFSDLATTAVPSTGTNPFAYYFFEDVSVAPVCNQLTNKFVACGAPILFDQPAGFDACSGTNVTVSIAGTVTNSLCPLVVTRTWLLADLCGNTNTASQTLTVLGGGPPTVNCACLQTAASAVLSTNGCPAYVPNFSFLTNSGCISNTCASFSLTQSPPAGTQVDAGPHPITISISDCSGNSNVCVLVFSVTQGPSSFSLICSSNKTVQCGIPWDFDRPVPVTTCCNDKVSINPPIRVTNGTCPQTITGTFYGMDSCGNTSSCSQTVTIIDTRPPVALCSGVNLVPNGDFEGYGVCPVGTSQLSVAAPWYSPTLGSSDYFNGCAPPPFTSVPTNFTGVQAALSGQGYGGAILYYPSGNTLPGSYREYLQVPLLAPLLAGQSYRISFYVNQADYDAYSIANIGAYLSVGPVTNYAYSGGLAVVPQVANPPSNPLTSTNSWMLITGLFTAIGGEDHLTLGNFASDAATTAVPAAGNEGYTYYLFDDVSVVAQCPALVTNKTVLCGSPLTFDPPVGIDACSGSNVTLSVLSTVTNGLCPRTIIRTWLMSDACGNSNVWSQTVTVIDNTTPTIKCGCLYDSALSLLSTNGCSGIVPNLSSLTNSPCVGHGCGPLQFSQSPPAGTLVTPGVHQLTVSFFTCSGASNGCVLPFTVNGSTPTIICPHDIVRFSCGASVPVFFAPQVSGNTGTIVCSPPSGSLFPFNTSTLITCTVTNDCGGSATCTFAVTVMRPPGRWSCNTIIVIGIPLTPVGTAIVTYLPPLPGGGLGVDFDNLGSSGQDGVEMDLGAAEKLTFSTVLDFNAPLGATFTLALPGDAANGTGPEPIVTFTRNCQPNCGWSVSRPNATTSHRSIAIGSDGDLFSSFVQDGATLGTNILANLTPGAGVSNSMMTLTLDCRTRELSLAFPFCTWTPDPARKGWDGLIFANGLRGSKTNQNARLILTPLTTVLLPPISTLALLAGNLSTVAFDNPLITVMGRKWGDGHVTLMKAYDDGEPGLEFAAFGPGGGVTTDLGNASSFSFRLQHFQDGTIPNQEQLFTIRGWPPGTTTNRPPPRPIFLRLAQNSSGGTGIDCAADYASFGISNVTLQLWNGATLVSEKPHVPATLASSIATLSGFPIVLSCPGNGVLSLSHTNPFAVISGLDCPATGCIGTELRIVPEFTSATPPPVAFAELTCALSDGMDNLLYHLESTPACSPIPLNVSYDPAGNIILSWTADGFHLLGAENANGPWYNLGVTSPVSLSVRHSARFFRLSCD
jgi:hypothetical protein